MMRNGVCLLGGSWLMAARGAESGQRAAARKATGQDQVRQKYAGQKKNPVPDVASPPGTALLVVSAKPFETCLNFLGLFL